MVDALQYISDLRDPDLLRTTIEEYLSVCVIPIKTDRPAAIMASVKIKVLLPLNREIFALGTVIMHRPDGFLVQLDCAVDLNFLKATLTETVTAEVVGQAALRPARPEGVAPRPKDPDVRATSAAASPDAPARTPAGSTPTSAAQPSEEAYTGRISGKVEIVDRFDTAATANKNAPNSQFERPAARAKPEPSRPIAPLPVDDDYTISSISAVDKDTGLPRGTGSQPVIHPEKTRRERPSVSATHSTLDDEFGASRKPGSTEGSGLLTAKESTRRFFSPESIEKVRGADTDMPPVSQLAKGSDPVDELFSLAAEAGAIDLADSGLLDLHRRTDPELQPADYEDATVRTGNEPTRPAYRRPEQVTQAPVAGPASSDEEPAEESAPQIEPENRELAVRIREMSTIEKQKLARQGKRVARRILVRDNDKTVHKFIFFNPDVQLDEVIEYTRWASLAPDAIEFIASSRAWMESRDVIFNIVKNPSTPIELAVRYVLKLSPGEWRMLARPGVVRPPIMNQARKLLFEAEKKS
ncbi:MAG TPA: hypothetical protein PKG98_02660 [Myxococcota bacterium]|nr:hypothetical protein [Myxococcota bacterium]